MDFIFFSPMKYIDNMKPIVKARQNYDIITKESNLFLQTLMKFQIAFNSLSDISIHEISTEQNSSLDDIILEHMRSIHQFNQAFHNFSISLKNDCKNIVRNYQLRQMQRESLDNEIKSLNQSILQLLDKNVKGNIIEARNNLKDKINLLNKISKNKSKAKATEDMRNEYPKYRQLYGIYTSKQEKLNKMIDTLQTLVKNYHNALHVTDYSFRGQLVSSSLRLITIHLDDLGTNLINTTSIIKPQSLTFNDDFTNFAKIKNIEFFDIHYTKFLKLKTVGDRGVILEKSNNVNIFPNMRYRLPEFIAQTKAEFRGQNLNELTVRKGQKIGVLNEKDQFDGWSLCMNLYSDEIGYVPTAYIEKVGKGIAVVKSDLNIYGFDGDKGRLLTFIDEEGTNAICEDYCGQRRSIPKSKLIVIESNRVSEKLTQKVEEVKSEPKQNSEPKSPQKYDLTFNSSLYMNMSDFEEIERIGKGSFSVVMKYRHKKTGELFAFKIIQILSSSNTEESQRTLLELRREIIITSAFNDPTLHSLYGIIDDLQHGQFIIITPFYKNGDLSNMIDKETKKQSPPEWDLTQKLIVVYGIASGMFILHQQDIIHRDLKPENILLNDSLEPLITDFGLSKLVDPRNSMFQTQAAGTPIFTAPEVFMNEGMDTISYDGKKADVYAFSILCYQLLTLSIPYGNISSQFQLINAVTNGQRPEFPEKFNSSIQKLIEDCWNQEPNDRPSFEHILEVISSVDFIQKVEGVDQQRFNEYKNKVVPDPKFIINNEFNEDIDEEIQPFDPNNFTIKPSLLKEVTNYEKIGLIGKGRSGFVFKCEDKETGSIVALKEFNGEFKAINIQREIWIQITFHHPSIQSICGIVENKTCNEIMIISPFYEKGDLTSMMNCEAKNESPLKWDFTQKYIVVYGIAAGMYFLHKHDVIHRDLKPGNILLNEKLEPIITDFGLSKSIDQKNTLFQSAVFGTPVFMAPEIVFSESKNGVFSYDGKKSDVYSFAMLCYQLLSGIQPFRNAVNQFQLYRILSNGERPSIPDDFNANLKELIEFCWSQNPDERPSFESIIEKLGSQEFIEGIGHIELDRFVSYQRRVVPRKFRTISIEKVYEPEKSRSNSIRKSPHQIIKEMADAGDKESQYNYGCLLFEGRGVEKDEEKAVIYFKKSSDNGYIDGIIQYAKCLKEGIGVTKDDKEAYRLMETAANNDDSEAQYNLGVWYANDHPPQYVLASKWLKKAADNSRPDPEAPATYATILEKGKLGRIPPLKVITEYYKKASDLGSPKGMYHMALLYHSGENPFLKKDLKEAIRLYEISSTKGIQDAILSLSYAYEEIGQFEEAFNNAMFYAQKDDFYGYLLLSELYEKGIGVTQNTQKSNEYLKIACDKKFTQNQTHVSIIFSRGKGMKVDKEKAFFWAKISAENGSAEGASILGNFYFEKNEIEKALEWGKKGSERGDVSSLRLLSKIYGKLNNDEYEIKFLNEAAEKGDEKSMIKLGKIYQKKLKEFNSALFWFKKAADNMNPVGCFLYGEMMINGTQVEKNVQEGLKFLNLSADLNNLNAVELLAEIYKNGNFDVKKDENKATEYYKKLIELKNIQSKS